MPWVNSPQEWNLNMFTPEELIYTPEEMEKWLSISKGSNWQSFFKMTKKTQKQLIKDLENRQQFKDNNKELQWDPNKHIRQAQRPDLWY
jgi:hypothetical protein